MGSVEPDVDGPNRLLACGAELPSRCSAPDGGQEGRARSCGPFSYRTAGAHAAQWLSV